MPNGVVFSIDYQRQFQAQQRVWRSCAFFSSEVSVAFERELTLFINLKN